MRPIDIDCIAPIGIDHRFEVAVNRRTWHLVGGAVAMLAVLAMGCGVHGLETRTEPASSDANSATPSAEPATQRAPDFTLADTDGTLVGLDDLLGSGAPAVLVFYRGHW